jgi:hypothetical protein
MKSGASILLDRAVLLDWAMSQSRKADNGHARVTERILVGYASALYETPGMSAVEHVLRSSKSLSAKLVPVPGGLDLNLDASGVKALDGAIDAWCRSVPVLQAAQVMERALAGPQRDIRTHLGYVVRLLLLARHFDADVLTWWHRAPLIKAMLESSGGGVELTDVSAESTAMSSTWTGNGVIPKALEGEFRIVFGTPAPDGRAWAADESPPNMRAGAAANRRKRIFLSYAHQDAKWFDLVANHLRPLSTSGDVEPWSDRDIDIGQHWEAEIRKAIDSSSIAILLVTPNFLASRFIVEVELPALVERAASNQVKLAWLAVSAALYDQTDLKTFQAANDPSVPLDLLSPARRNQELVRICRRIRDMILGE